MVESPFRFFGRPDRRLIDPGDHIALLEAGRIAEGTRRLEDQRTLWSSEPTLGLNGRRHRHQLEFIGAFHLGRGAIWKIPDGRIHRREPPAALDRILRHAAPLTVEPPPPPTS